jgi:hypothetical protein
MSFNILETKIRMALDKWSNDEPIEYKEEWIEEAGEQFKDALRKQLKPRENQFRMRMSNIGRPLCQLQMEKMGEERSRNSYNSIIRFLLGDATEVLVEFVLKVAGVNVTGGKSEAKLSVNGTTILGENDVEIDNKIYDTKSSSPWAYEHKWGDGWQGVAKDDPFGYINQLYGYSEGTGLEPGGWIVVNKSTGELRVVDAEFTTDDKDKIRTDVSNTVEKLMSDAPFERCFEPQDEYFQRKLTGSKRLPMNCTFCPYLNKCWPDAVYKPQTGSKAVSPRHFWYSEYAGDK